MLEYYKERPTTHWYDYPHELAMLSLPREALSKHCMVQMAVCEGGTKCIYGKGLADCEEI